VHRPPEGVAEGRLADGHRRGDLDRKVRGESGQPGGLLDGLLLRPPDAGQPHDQIPTEPPPRYTVPRWAFPPNVELTQVEGDHQVAPGVQVVATPGHTPGHQSVLIEDDDGRRTVVCCQAAWNVESFEVASPGDEGWDRDAGAASVRKLRALEPDRVLFSHDAREWHPPVPERA
jgi:glyoxylase-like metal-dependent hydrolase (beta-lactamase superfamily II)